MYRGDNPPGEVTEPAELMTQEEAAVALDCLLITIGRLIGEGRLRPVTYRGAPGVERASVDAELAGRVGHWRLRNLLRALRYWI